MSTPADAPVTPNDERGTADDGGGRGWFFRLGAPLLGWAAIAFGLWKGPALLASLFEWGDDLPWSPFTAAILSLFSVFATSALYIFLACRGGAFPRKAWLLAPFCIILGVCLSIVLGADGSDALAASLLFLLAAPLLGDMVSRMIEKREYMLPALAVALLADVWSVLLGPTQAIVDSGAAKYVTISYPVAGVAQAPPVHVVGVMDWIFIAFLVHVVVKFDLPRWKLAPALLLGLGGGLALLILLEMPLPLLATIAPGFALIYIRDIKPSWQEIRTTLIFLLTMLGIFLLIGAMRPPIEHAPLTTEVEEPMIAPAEPPIATPQR